MNKKEEDDTTHAVKVFAKLRQLKDDFRPTEEFYQRAVGLAQEQRAAETP